MSEARECGNCGAAAARADSRFCEYCGTEFPRPQEAEPVRVEVVGPLGNLEERFERLKSHPSYERMLRRTPSTAKPAVGMYGGAIGTGIFTVAAIVMTLLFAAVAGPLAIVPALMAVFGMVFTVKMLSRASRYSSAPLLRKPAVILDERTKVSGGGKNSSASTSYFATLQFPDGRRDELAVDGRMAGIVTQGDIGVAFLKSDVLVAFTRVDV